MDGLQDAGSLLRQEQTVRLQHHVTSLLQQLVNEFLRNAEEGITNYCHENKNWPVLLAFLLEA